MSQHSPYSPGYLNPYLRLRRRLRSLLEQEMPKLVVEVGPTLNPRHLNTLSQLCGEIILIDVNPWKARVKRILEERRYILPPNVHLVIASAEAMPLREHTVNLVSAVGVIGFNRSLKPGKLLGEVVRVLAEGGWLATASRPGELRIASQRGLDMVEELGERVGARRAALLLFKRG